MFVDPSPGEDVNWLAIYEYAIRNLQPVWGTYHDNYVVKDPPLEPCVVRVPRHRRSADVEPRMFAEPAILEAAAKAKAPCPRLLHSSVDPAFQVHSIVPGQPLSATLPAAGPVPAVVTSAVSSLLRSLSEVAVDIRPAPWPTSRGPTYPTRIAARSPTPS